MASVCPEPSSSAPPRYFFPATVLAHMDSEDPDPLEHQAEFFNIMEVSGGMEGEGEGGRGRGRGGGGGGGGEGEGEGGGWEKGGR